MEPALTPEPPPPAFTDFAIAEPLLQAVQKMGFTQPTAVQAAAIPRALTRCDLLVSAETGSGKTTAFLLPTIQHLLSNPAEQYGTRALVLVPTRELAKQIYQQCQQLLAFTGLQVGLITGGADFRVQQNMLRKNTEIVISTPGRLLELMAEKTPDFSHLDVLILDEADRMLDMGFSHDLQAIAAQCSKQRQTLLFSATLNHEGIIKIAERVLREPEMIGLNTLQDQHNNIEQQVIIADNTEHKQRLLAWLLLNETFVKALVFTNSRAQADNVSGVLQAQRVRCGVLHGDMDQKERNRIMTLFREGTINTLIATDLAARGLDIPGVELVVNFDMPRTGIHYIHRIGRTGRGATRGLTIALIQSSEWNLMVNIERFLKQQFKRRSIKGLEGTYTGPKKLKASGKAAGSKKKKLAKKAAALKKGKKR
ncbi:Superfamily II DNA and RNA helicase [Thiothrix caldifontis]|uniref:Superfamily II DNA and RNA helicase n=1 Tax=Thiothrix caldifontis TaxID=525918 RepID=A0A1H4CNE3_9GAMM|nr:DEAD/DEAH box helicase [Thiothrix caldifontis]SEA61965.1 Superfamily II DNA and RNA helicase [Thiothrix caldifontis]